MLSTRAESLPIVPPGSGVFAGRECFGFGIRREIEEVRFDTTGLGIRAGVGMHRQKQVGGMTIGDGRSFFEWHEYIRLASEDDVNVIPLGEECLETHADVEHEVGFGQS